MPPSIIPTRRGTPREGPMKRALFLVALGLSPVAGVRAQEAHVVTAFLGEQFYDSSAAAEASGVLGVRWAWYARTYGAGAGVRVGEDRLRFRYDVRVIRFGKLFNNGNGTTLQTTGGFAWIF